MQFYTRSLLLSFMLLMVTDVIAVEVAQENNVSKVDDVAIDESTETITEESADIPIEEQADDSDTIEAFPEEEETEQKDMLSVLDAPHKYVSEYVEWLVTGVDKFFANEAIYNYTTDSYVQLTGEISHEEMTANTSLKAGLRARVDLPRTKKKLKLLIDTDPTEKQDPISRSVDEIPPTETQGKDVYASVQRERERKGWLIRPSLGMKIRLPLEPFAKLQFTNLYPFERWQLRLDENLYWFKDSGFGSDSTFEYNLSVGNDNLFRATSFARLTEETDYFALSQTFAFYHTISARRRISFQIGAYGQTKPTWHMTQYLAVIRYRQNLHKDWLFFEVQPQVLYQKINEWNDEISLLLKLELLFGRKYL
jgi:hypothetical protein